MQPGEKAKPLPPGPRQPIERRPRNIDEEKRGAMVKPSLPHHGPSIVGTTVPVVPPSQSMVLDSSAFSPDRLQQDFKKLRFFRLARAAKTSAALSIAAAIDSFQKLGANLLKSFSADDLRIIKLANVKDVNRLIEMGVDLSEVKDNLQVC
jgi:hypothetical protein